MKKLAAAVLFAIALFMLLGFFRADLDASPAVVALTLLFAVGLPAAGGVALLLSGRKSSRHLVARREALRQRTLHSELVRLAGERDGKLTVHEAVAELAVDKDAAEAMLQNLAVDGLAEVELGPTGTLVYTFRDLHALEREKAASKGVLDA